MKRLIATSLLGLMAYAAPVLSPQGIIVNPVPTDLEVQTWVDRDPSGLGNSTYFFGDKIQIYTRVNQSAYVYLFNINADGQIDLILPNAFNPNNYLRAGETRVFPENGARYEFTISGPAGVDQVLAVASRTPLSLAQIADIRSGQMRVQGASNLARALSATLCPGRPSSSSPPCPATLWCGKTARTPSTAWPIAVVMWSRFSTTTTAT